MPGSTLFVWRRFNGPLYAEFRRWRKYERGRLDQGGSGALSNPDLDGEHVLRLYRRFYRRRRADLLLRDCRKPGK